MAKKLGMPVFRRMPGGGVFYGWPPEKYWREPIYNPGPCPRCGGTGEVSSYSMGMPLQLGAVSLVGQGNGQPAKAYVDGVERPDLVREERKPCPDCKP